jgi:transcriptional regulator with XRE-family HTH domain
MLPSVKETRFDENEREFLGLTLARQIFGALYTALQYRRESEGFTRADFGERTGRDKTGVSKLLKGPGNWTIHKISDVANALDLDVEIAFFDRNNQARIFTATGMHYTPSQSYSLIGDLVGAQRLKPPVVIYSSGQVEAVNAQPSIHVTVGVATTIYHSGTTSIMSTTYPNTVTGSAVAPTVSSYHNSGSAVSNG